MAEGLSLTSVVVIGATSAIARESARCFARTGSDFLLVARDEIRVGQVADDLIAHGARATGICIVDLVHLESHAKVFERAGKLFPSVDVFLIAHGVLPNQRECENSTAAAVHAVMTNCVSAIALTLEAVRHCDRQGRGTIAVLTSVAGIRGRASNYVYGASKAALSVLLEGLRHRFRDSAVAVVDIRLGPVDTPMTRRLEKGILWSTSKRAGRAVYRAVRRGKGVAYVPSYWRWIMLVIRLLPESVFARLRL